MKHPLLVINPCTRTTNAGTLDLLTTQLDSASIQHHVEVISEGPPLGWGLGTKISLYRDLVNKFGADYENFVITDAFDVTFYGKSAEEVVSRIPTDRVLCAAEKNCYPDPSLAPRIKEYFPERFPHTYYNGGLTAGTPANILSWLERWECSHKYDPNAVDQWSANELLADGSILINIDYKTTLFYCLFSGYEELKFVAGRPVNTMHKTNPLFCHANGGWNPDEMFSKYEESLK